jgi:glutamine cyclotransferase
MKYSFSKLVPCAALMLLCACSCNNTDSDAGKPDGTTTPTTETAATIPQLSYAVTGVYPHNNASFTEGLEWHDGTLYEGTGDAEYAGQSKLAKIDLKTGNDIKSIRLDKRFFGEGITLLNGKLYQMTYKEQKCFMYDAATFTKLKEFDYEGEGWGLTNDGKQLIMSNGSSNLYFRDPETFAVKNIVGVSNNDGPINYINELEYVDGFVYANVWQTNTIIKINPASGKVVAYADFNNLLQTYAPNAVNNPDPAKQPEAFNGIAYDKELKRFFVTGKYWPAVFEIRFQ